MEERARLGHAHFGIHPVPGLAGHDQVIHPSSRIPGLEGRLLHRDPVASGDRRHRRIGLDTEQVASTLDEQPRRLAGPAAHVEDASRRERHQRIDEGGGVRGPRLIVEGGDTSEGEGARPILVDVLRLGLRHRDQLSRDGCGVSAVSTSSAKRDASFGSRREIVTRMARGLAMRKRSPASTPQPRSCKAATVASS